MNQILALAFQESAPDDPQMWIILAVVLVVLFFIVVIVAVGLTIFFIMRKRSKALKASMPTDAILPTGPSAAAYAGSSQPETSYATTPQHETPYAGTALPETAYPPMSSPETAETLDPGLPSPLAGSHSPGYGYSPEHTPDAATAPFDPSQTVAIIRENTVAISYGAIKFVSGVLAGQQFDVEPEGSYIGRDNNLSEIVVSDPRISKRHLWIGVRDGSVRIVDQDSRNGTFLNDPKSDRITEAVLHSGDTVIMGESDVARFEYVA